MKYCSQCGHANEDDALFCVKDGCKLGEPIDGSQEDKPKKQICAKCGFENNEGVKFCGTCGNMLKKKKKHYYVRFIHIVLVILIFVAIGYILKEGGRKFINKPDSYYLELVSNHSFHISSEGGTIMFKINTNADWLTKDDFKISISGAIGNVTFIDDRNFMVKLGRNERDKEIIPDIWIRLSEAGRLNFFDYIGVKMEDDVDYEEDDEMSDREQFWQYSH